MYCTSILNSYGTRKTLIQRNSNKYTHFEILDCIRESPLELDEFINVTQAA